MDETTKRRESKDMDNILETVQGRSDTVRFVFDTVFELFVSEVDAETIRSDAELGLNSILEKLFSGTLTRLNRLGSLLAGSAEGNDFVEKLARIDYARALVLIQSGPGLFSRQAQALVCDAVAQAFNKATRPERAFIIKRLGYIDTIESRTLIEKLVLPSGLCPLGLQHIAAHTIAALSIEKGVDLLASCTWFDGYWS